MTFRVLSANHTSFTVSSLDRTPRFFTECLAFQLVSRAPRDPRVIQKITGVDDVDAAVAASARYGVAAINPPVVIDQGPNKGKKVVYLRDADGVTLEYIGN